MPRCDLYQKYYPKGKKTPRVTTEEDKMIARKFGQEFFDGDRRYGYGGYKWIPGFWTPIVKAMIETYKPKGVADVGCAKGYMLKEFLAHGVDDVDGIDISDYAALKSVEDDCTIPEIGGANDLRMWEPKQWDLVTSINVIHNLPLIDCKMALKEIQRVGKQAFIVVDAWNTEEEKERFLQWNLTALTYMSCADWEKLFAEVGYTGDWDFNCMGA